MEKIETKTITEELVFGKSNLNGKLVSADFDDKNLLTDWLEEFLFDNNCVTSKYGRICGYAELLENEKLCEVIYTANVVAYTFPANLHLYAAEFREFVRKLKENIFHNDRLTVKVVCDRYIDSGDYRTTILVAFFFRDDEPNKP